MPVCRITAHVLRKVPSQRMDESAHITSNTQEKGEQHNACSLNIGSFCTKIRGPRMQTEHFNRICDVIASEFDRPLANGFH